MAPVESPPLHPGESLLWSGRPDPESYGLFHASMHSAVHFCFFLFGCFLFIPLLLRTEPPIAGWGLLASFTAVWLAGNLFGMIWHPRLFERLARDVRYTVTCRRIVIAEQHPLVGVRVREWRHEAVTFVELHRRSDLLGDVYFFKRPSGWFVGPVPLHRADGFIGIENPEEIERLLWKARAGGVDVEQLAKARP